jgi:hypothetical protein
MINISMSKMKEELEVNFQLGRQVAMFGASGIAKTSSARQLAEELKVPFLVIDAPITDPLLLNGIPVVEDGYAKNIPYDIFKPFVETKGIILIDEIAQAPRTVTNLLSALLNEKRAGQLQLHPETMIIATGNRREDLCSTELLGSHVLNRMKNYQVYLPAEDWIKWGYSQNLDTRVLAFIKFRNDMLHNFTKEDHVAQRSFATPRSWAMLAEEFTIRIPPLEAICACVGESAGVTFKSFLDLSSELPDLDDLLRNPASYTKPSNYGLYLAMIAGITGKIVGCEDKVLISGFFTLLKEFEPELQVMCIKPCLKNKLVEKHKDMKSFLLVIKEYLA